MRTFLHTNPGLTCFGALSPILVLLPSAEWFEAARTLERTRRSNLSIDQNINCVHSSTIGINGVNGGGGGGSGCYVENVL
jgi:hypothetical protein